ncbi:MAG: PAS domain S-box protein [bacterium]|nr:PAS domain S-box protein [bacterium]
MISWILAAVALALLIVLGRTRAALRRLGESSSAAEHAKRASEATLALAFRASPDSIIVTSLPDGRLIDFNDGFTRWSGYRREEALGRTTRELEIWGIAEDRDRILGMLSAEGRVVELETSLRLKSGELRPVSISAEFIADGEQKLVSVLRDVSEHKRAQESLRVSEEKFSKAFRASPDAILISSIPDGKIADFNEGFTRLTGWSREEVIGRTALDIGVWVEPEARERLMEELRREGRVRERPNDFRMKSGEVRSLLVWIEVIEIAGEPHILTVAHDVTERRRAEAEREAFVRELEAKNAELERFTYTVSHDLKSPLVTIRGFLGLLQQDAERGNAELMRNDMARIEAATETMGRLLEELLELSRVGRVLNPAEEIPLGELAREAVDLVAGQIAERRGRVEIEPDLPRVVGDRTRLLEVYQNLIDNAIKFTGDHPEPRVEVGVRRDGAERVFYVSDNGIGIDPRYHDKVFGLFERLDQSIAGTGVGLALVKRIVEVHGGRVWVESEGQGRGSTFCFTLADAGTLIATDP